MIRKEFSTLTQHKGLMLTMVAIILIPFFYSFCFLTSAWDPYGNTGKIPVAVVNLDQPAELQGTKITAGADTVHNLRNDDQLEWHFVSAAKAKAGMKHNDYYTVVTIPKNFSAHAATALNAHPKQMQLTYQTNGSLNYVSEIISQVGADKLNSQIKEKVTTAFLTQLFAKINGMGTQLKTAADGSAQLKDGVGQYTDGVTQVDDGLSQLNTGLGTLYSQVPTLASGVNQLNNGGGQLQTGLGQLKSQTPALASGVGKLSDGANQLSAKITGSGKTGTLANGIKQLNDGIKLLKHYTLENRQAKNTVDKTTFTAPPLPTAVSQLQAGMTQLRAAVDHQASLINKVFLQFDFPVSPSVAKMTADDMAQLGITADSQVWPLIHYENAQRTSTAAADQKLTALETAVSATDDTAAKKALEEFKTAYTQEKTANADAYGTTKNYLKFAKTSITRTDNQADGTPLGLQEAVALFDENLTNLNNELSNSKTSDHDAYAKAVNKLVVGMAQLNDAVNVPKKAGTPSLSQAITQLQAGLNQLNSKVPTLTSGVNQLYTGSTQLAGGLNQLQGNVPALSSGVSQLYTGSGQLKDGTTKLTANNAKLNDGTDQLATGLADGYQQLSATKLTKLTAKMFAAPSKDVQLKYTTVKNYGAALAPYVLALALFIAIIIFNFAYPMKRKDADDQPLLQWLGGKVLMGTLVAVAAGFTEATLIILISHLPVAHVGAFYAITILFALSAMYLTQMLNIAFNRVGIFIALGLLTLSGSGGLFPAETISPLYESTQKFLAMTYAINGYRDAISGGIAGDTVAISVMLLVVVALLSLALMLPAAKLRDPQSTTSPTD